MTQWKRPYKLYILAILCTILWGSAIPLIKLGYAVFDIATDATADKLLFAGIRFLGAGLIILVPYFIFCKKNAFAKGLCISALALGLVQTAGQYFFMYIGLAYTTGVNASVFNSAGSLLYLVLAFILYRNEKLTGAKAFGCVIGFLGILLNTLATQKMGIMSFQGDGFIIISNVCVAVGFLYSKHSVRRTDPFLLTGLQMGIGGVVLLVIGIVLGGELPRVSVGGLLLLLYLMLVSSVAFSLWTLLLKEYPPALVGVFNFLTPVFGTMFSYILSRFGLLNEASAFTVYTVLAIICCAAGIFLSSLSPKKRATIPCRNHKKRKVDEIMCAEPNMNILDPSKLSFPSDIRYTAVSRLEEGGYRFSLGASIIRFHGIWVAAYLQSAVKENDDRSRFVCKFSFDDCRTWSDAHVIADVEGEYGRSHGVLYRDGETLWAFCPKAKFNGTDRFAQHNFSMEGYTFCEQTLTWEAQGAVLEDGFWPLCEPMRLQNGDVLIAGLECKGTHQPAVAIAKGGDLTHFEMVQIPNPDGLRTWGETTVLDHGEELVALVRPHPTVGLVLVSRSCDYGRNWTPLSCTEQAAIDSKLYAGRLSNGRRYLICNIGTGELPPADRSRKTMAILLGEGDDPTRFDYGYLIRHGFDVPATYFKSQWAYPYAVEENGSLYVIYTKHKEETELAIIPLASL